MAGMTLMTGIGPQQVMVESSGLAIALHPGVIAMAGHAVILDELLVEGCRCQGVGDGLRRRGQATNVRWLVTGHTALCRGPHEGSMTGEAVPFQILVADDQLAGSYHQIRIGEGEDRQNDQVGCQYDFDGTVHSQPQNRKILTM